MIDMASKGNSSGIDNLINSMIRMLNHLHLSDWHSLGVELGISLAKLRCIEANYQDLSRRLSEVIYAWADANEDFSWEILGVAVCNIRNHQEQGREILRKHAPHLLPSQQAPPVVTLVDRSEGQRFNSHIESQRGMLSHVEEPVHGYTGQMNYQLPMIQPPYAAHVSSPQHHIRQLHAPLINPPPSPSPSQRSLTSSVASAISSQAPLVVLPNGELVNLPSSHPLLPYQNQDNNLPTDSTSNEDLLKVHMAEKYITRLEEKFTDLLTSVTDFLVAEKIEIEKLKRFIKFTIPNTRRYGYNFLKEHLHELEEVKSIEDVITYLLQFVSFDNYRLIEKLVHKFIEKSAGELLKSYIGEYEDFISTCELAPFALAYNKRDTQPFAPNRLSVHFNDSWESRNLHDMKQFHMREFHQQYASEFAFKMVRCEKRSILVTWETTNIVIKELSKNCVERFFHLRTQGVLQIIIGEYEIDLSNGQPNLYKYQILDKACLNKYPSLLSLTSDLSKGTQNSKESGFVSGSTSLSSIQATISDEGEMIKSFTSDTISLQKGDKIKILSMKDTMVNLKGVISGQCGNVPLDAILILPKHDDEGTNKQQEYPIIRAKMTSTNPEWPEVSSITVKEEITDVPLRPDTPPLEAFLESKEINLSENLNSCINIREVNFSNEEKSKPLKDEEFLAHYYPDLSKTMTKLWKTSVSNLMKYLRLTRSPSHEAMSRVYTVISEHQKDSDSNLSDPFNLSSELNSSVTFI
jgi:hypothetical protein